MCLGNGNVLCVPGDDPHGFSEDQLRGLFLGLRPERLPGLRTIDAVESDLHGRFFAKHCDGIAVIEDAVPQACESMRPLRKRYRNPAMSAEEFLASLSRKGLKRTADLLGQRIDLLEG